MISRYEAYMDGEALSAIDPSIYVLNIQPGEVKNNIRRSTVAGRPGSRVTKRQQDSTSVTIVFEIHEYDTVKRQTICQKVQKWANGAILRVSDRPEQRLRAACESFPKVNAKEWTEAISMTFTAYNPPYWEERNKTTVVVTGSNTSGQAYVPGNADRAYVEVTVKANASVSGFTVSVGNYAMTVTESMSANDTVTIAYDDNMILQIKKGNTSILGKRTGADDLIAKCGAVNTFALSASASVTATFSVRGCWR